MKNYNSEGFESKLKQILDTYEVYFDDFLFKETGYRFQDIPESLGLEVSINEESGEILYDKHETGAAVALLLIEVIKSTNSLKKVICWLDVVGTIYGYLKYLDSGDNEFFFQDLFRERGLKFKQVRAKGAFANKEKSKKNKTLILNIDNDLLKHPNWARKTLDDRANYIADKCKLNNIKMINGKCYSIRYIKDLITGHDRTDLRKLSVNQT